MSCDNTDGGGAYNLIKGKTFYQMEPAGDGQRRERGFRSQQKTEKKNGGNN